MSINLSKTLKESFWLETNEIDEIINELRKNSVSSVEYILWYNDIKILKDWFGKIFSKCKDRNKEKFEKKAKVFWSIFTRIDDFAPQVIFILELCETPEDFEKLHWLINDTRICLSLKQFITDKSNNQEEFKRCFSWYEHILTFDEKLQEEFNQAKAEKDIIKVNLLQEELFWKWWRWKELADKFFLVLKKKFSISSK